MAYEGERLRYCSKDMFDFSRTWVVIVSGSGPNLAGHMLLNTGGRGGNYFQTAGVYTEPLFMNEAGYQRYLKEQRKTEIRRFPVKIPRPYASQLKLEELLSKRWKWLVIKHNCEGMVEEIIMAGGGPILHDEGEWLLPALAYPH